MEDLSPENVEYWADKEGNKSRFKKQTGDQEIETTSSQMENASQQDKANDKQSSKSNAEERSPEWNKLKYNAGYYLGDGQSLRDYPDRESSLTLSRWRSNNKATSPESRSDESGDVESEQMQVVPLQEMVDKLNREQAAKDQATHAETGVKPTRLEDVVDDPGEWDTCQ